MSRSKPAANSVYEFDSLVKRLTKKKFTVKVYCSHLHIIINDHTYHIPAGSITRIQEICALHGIKFTPKDKSIFAYLELLYELPGTVYGKIYVVVTRGKYRKAIAFSKDPSQFEKFVERMEAIK